MYLLQIKDVNRDLVLDLVFSLPESISSSVKLGSPDDEDAQLQAVWETGDATSDSFKADVNRLLEHWLVQIQHANTFEAEPDIYYLPRAAKLKWPWKTSTNENYFRTFKSESQIHQLRLGVGYFASDRNAVGVTMQLSNYPGKTLSALQENSRKRGKRPRTEISSEEVGEVVEQEESS